MEVIIIITVGERIRSLRKQKKLTQPQLAELINKKISTISSYEHGVFDPSIPTIFELCKAFDVSADYLLFGNEKTPDNTLMLDNKILLDKFSKLDNIEKIKVEGIIDGLLLSKEIALLKDTNKSIE